MPDEETPPPEDDEQKPDEEKDGDESFDADRAKAKINKANSEAANLRKRLKELEPIAKKAKELEDASKSEGQKLTEERDGHKSRADKAEIELTRLRVALRKGLTEAQSKRLIGDSEADIEADADELLATFSGGKPPAPKDRPRERLRGGGDPDDEPDESDPVKLAEKVSRDY